MFCVKCGHKETSVVNSRGHKKTAQVWRRRFCGICKTTFTTLEKPVLTTAVRVYSPKNDSSRPFNLGKLIHSISKSFAHDPALGIESSVWLAETVIANLTPAPDGVLTTPNISNSSYNVLIKFDRTAAAQYGLAHGIIKTPSLRRKS